MNARTYNLDANAAKQADSMGNRITETGKYVGRFTRAEAITSKQETDGIEFSFENDAGQSADFLTLWTYNRDGKEVFGLKTLNALMTCMRVKSIAPKDGIVEKFENGSKQKVKATLFPDLMGKPIGLLLQREPYEKRDGSMGYKFNIAGCFDASDERTASEIIEKKTTAEKLGQMVAALKDRPMQASKSGSSHPNAPVNGGDFGGFDDEVPF